MKQCKSLVALSVLAFSGSLSAGVMGPVGSPAGAFVGLGGSYNTVSLLQNLNYKGSHNFRDVNFPDILEYTTDVDVLKFRSNQNTFAPEAQLGYLSATTPANNFWGIKFSYQYLGLAATNTNTTINQSFFLQDTDAIVFNERTGAQGVETDINHQLNLIALVGHKFTNANLYIGAGPVVFGTNINFNNLSSQISQPTVLDPQLRTPLTSASSFVTTDWIWGGAGQIGFTYFLDPTWFFDVNYTYAGTGTYEVTQVAPIDTKFYNTGSFEPQYIESGSLLTTTRNRITVQAVNFTINKLFNV
jgi:hypothetical protein